MFRINTSKKIIAVGAALILLYNSGGYIFVYQQLIYLTKNNIHSAIEKKEIDEEIILLSFKKSDIDEGIIDFKWKHKKEFRYNGGMYDIVERIDTEDSIHFYCFYDHKENRLEADFNKHYEKEEKKNNTSGRNLLAQLVTDLFYLTPGIMNPQDSREYYSFYPEKENTLNIPEVPSPPPKLINFI